MSYKNRFSHSMRHKSEKGVSVHVYNVDEEGKENSYYIPIY